MHVRAADGRGDDAKEELTRRGRGLSDVSDLEPRTGLGLDDGLHCRSIMAMVAKLPPP